MANITRATHANCWRLEFTSNGDWDSNGFWGRVGDVRRCVHGKIQIRRQVSIHSRTAGPGTDWWQTLSPIWDPILYRRARKALS